MPPRSALHGNSISSANVYEVAGTGAVGECEEAGLGFLALGGVAERNVVDDLQS